MNSQKKMLIIVTVVGLICAVVAGYFITTNFFGKNATYNTTNNDNIFNVPKDVRVEVTSGDSLYGFLYEECHFYVYEYTLSGRVIAASEIDVPRSAPYTFKSSLTGFTFRIIEITDVYVTIDLS
jgi:heme/copper-type cytochrome/quinol oxidase subunit 2